MKNTDIVYPEDRDIPPAVTIAMQLAHAIYQVFVQLEQTLRQLTPHQYTAPSHTLFNASIGQHVRHIIELFQCLELGYVAGVVNYEKRKRDMAIETDPMLAIQLLQTIGANLQRPDKNLSLEADYDQQSGNMVVVQSNYYREIMYNLEHTIHHMALIRVGVRELTSITLPADFGVASSTIKHRQLCAQ